MILHKNISKNNKRLIIVGDIHGCYYTLQELLSKIGYCNQNDILISVGDLIEKGPNSDKVIDWFATNKCNNVYAVRGNHEDKILKSKQSSYSQSQLDFISSLPYTISIDEINTIVVHAGLIQGIPLCDQNLHDITTMRNIDKSPDGELVCNKGTSIGEEWYKYWTSDKFIIYGHAAKRGLVRFGNTLGLDSGCCYGKKLTACVIRNDINNLEIVSVDNIDTNDNC